MTDKIVTTPKTVDQMLDELEIFGRKKLGSITEKDMRQYHKLVFQCIQQMQKDRHVKTN